MAMIPWAFSSIRLRALLSALIITVAGNTSAGELYTVSGSEGGYKDGPVATALFSGPSGIAVDDKGDIFVADSKNHRIRKISSVNGTLVVSTLAGSHRGTRDGIAAQALFNYPTGVAVDKSGNVFVAEYYGHRIRKITGSGSQALVSTVAGNDSGFADGALQSARFKNPAGLAVDAAGNLYVADSGNNRIRKITGTRVSTVAGVGAGGKQDGPALSARFSRPFGVALDSTGSIYVADRGNNRVRKISFADKLATVSTVAGNLSEFNSPYGVAIDKKGAVLVVDSMNNRIRAIIFDAQATHITTIAGSGQGNSTDGHALQAGINYPNGVAVSPTGDIYIAEDGGDRIRKITMN